MPGFSDDGRSYVLDSPTLAPQAGGYLWNQRMMIQTTCRGFAVAQFMQPDPAKYAHVPTLAGVSFMQPEQPYFTHHPGRFFYVRDDETQELFSAPYEPTRAALDAFEFIPDVNEIRWRVRGNGVEIKLRLGLDADVVAEFWEVEVSNVTSRPRRLSLIPYFPVGYSSWMNMQAQYEPELGGVVASCVAPYQKLQDYFKRKDWKDLTVLLAERAPTSWEANQAAFEGEGGLHAPDALRSSKLACGDARYEIPACVLHYALHLEPGASETLRFLFGPAKDRAEVARLRHDWLSVDGFARARDEYAAYIERGRGSIQIETPDETFNHFVNHWLPRQVYYHGDVNRLTTDPQTRNYMQDAMGMVYVDARRTRTALLTALAQQKRSGEMPDGILLHPEAELKYINQIPHTDHCVWIALCLQAYLDETNDWALLDEKVGFADEPAQMAVYEHVCLAMDWLLGARDERGLSYIAQGDWCDPMNMVGYKGKGVSGWLTQAACHALQCLLPICRQRHDTTRGERYGKGIVELRNAVNTHLWDGDWYARGITDDGVKFGVHTDDEGRIFINTQSWAFLCGAASAQQQEKMLAAIDQQLETPYGVQLCAPAFTHMREDVGRVTQKFPGSGENGSVYNHAAAFYVAGLYQIGETERAYTALRKMLPGPDIDDLKQRGQMPVYIPNYYRGAYRQHPRTAGRSSHLFNTGTVAWVYRSIIESLFGLRGEGEGLRIEPELPRAWKAARAERRFRGATLTLHVRRDASVQERETRVDGVLVSPARIEVVESGRHYRVDVALPDSAETDGEAV